MERRRCLDVVAMLAWCLEVAVTRWGGGMGEQAGEFVMGSIFTNYTQCNVLSETDKQTRRENREDLQNTPTTTQLSQIRSDPEYDNSDPVESHFFSPPIRRQLGRMWSSKGCNAAVALGCSVATSAVILPAVYVMHPRRPVGLAARRSTPGPRPSFWTGLILVSVLTAREWLRRAKRKRCRDD